MQQANDNRVGVQAEPRLGRAISDNRLMLQKKDPGPEPEVFTPDGYSGGKGEPPDLKHSGH